MFYNLNDGNKGLTSIVLDNKVFLIGDFSKGLKYKIKNMINNKNKWEDIIMELLSERNDFDTLVLNKKEIEDIVYIIKQKI